MSDEGTPGPALDAPITPQERAYWEQWAADAIRLWPDTPAARIIPRLLAENAALRAEIERLRNAGMLGVPTDLLRAGDTPTAVLLRDRLQATQPPLPDPPDPTAPRQLGLGGQGDYASDHGKG